MGATLRDVVEVCAIVAFEAERARVGLENEPSIDGRLHGVRRAFDRRRSTTVSE